jgi:hypothetical protein
MPGGWTHERTIRPRPRGRTSGRRARPAMQPPNRPATTGRRGSASGRPRTPGRHQMTAKTHSPTTTTRASGPAHPTNDHPTGGQGRRPTPRHDRTVAGDRKGPRRGLAARPDKPRRWVRPTGKHHSSSPQQKQARQAMTACPSRRTSASGGPRGASQNPCNRLGAEPQGCLPTHGRACSGTPSIPRHPAAPVHLGGQASVCRHASNKNPGRGPGKTLGAVQGPQGAGWRGEGSSVKRAWRRHRNPEQPPGTCQPAHRRRPGVMGKTTPPREVGRG